MQAETVKVTQSGCRHAAPAWRLLFALLTCLAVIPVTCSAGSYLLVISGDGEIYSRFQKTLNDTLASINPDNSLTTRNISEFKTEPDVTRYDAIVSAGIEASTAISRLNSDTRILMAMLPKESYTTLSASGDLKCKANNCRVLFIDQPISRQLRLIKIALPDVKNIAVIGSDKSKILRLEIQSNAAKYGLHVNNISADNKSSLIAALGDDLADTGVLMAIPDPVVYNRNTARAILLSSFNQQVPLFAYSSSFVRAGATFGIYSSPEDIARQVAGLVCCIDEIKSQKIFPKYFTVDVNKHAVEALGISLPEADILKQKLMKNENK